MLTQKFINKCKYQLQLTKKRLERIDFLNDIFILIYLKLKTRYHFRVTSRHKTNFIIF